MRVFWCSLSLLFAVSASPGALPDTTGRRMLTFSGDVVFLREPAAVVAGESGVLVVKTLLPADRRHPSARGIDLREADTVVMANGRRMHSAKDIRDLYASLSPGSACKLALRRGTEMRMADFVIARPDDHAPTQMRIVAGGSDSAGVFPALGVTLASRAGHVRVEHLIDGDKAVLHGRGVAPGDRIVSVNGVAVSSVAAFARAFHTPAAGSALRLVVARGTVERTIVFPKPSPAGTMVIKRQGR
jgi:S1-C subfamily serine protease